MSCRGSATARVPRRRRLLLHPLLDRVLHILDFVDLDVYELPADFLDAADIDRLDDVAGFGIDRDRAARALPFHALCRANERFAVRLTAGLPQRFVDQVHAVPAP